METTLTALEQKVYDALKQNAMDATGGDFACAEEISTKDLGISKQQFGALLTTLETKGVISVDICYINDNLRRNSKGTKVTQVSFTEAL